MSWTGDQWRGLFALLDYGWPGDLSTDAADAYRALLEATDPRAVELGLRRLLHRGHKWRPSAAELLAAAREDPERPTFAEAYRLMYAVPGGAVFEDPAPGIHPLVLSFVQRHGAARLRTLHVDDPDWGEKVRRDLERDWEAHVQAMEGRETAALAGGGEPRALDPMRALALPNRPAPLTLPAVPDAEEEK